MSKPDRDGIYTLTLGAVTGDNVEVNIRAVAGGSSSSTVPGSFTNLDSKLDSNGDFSQPSADAGNSVQWAKIDSAQAAAITAKVNAWTTDTTTTDIGNDGVTLGTTAISGLTSGDNGDIIVVVEYNNTTNKVVKVGIITVNL